MPIEMLSTRVEAIPGAPLPHGLLSVATLLEPEDPHELLGVQWSPISCAEAETTTWCPPGDEEVQPKTFSGGGIAYAEPVTVYHGRVCSPIGQTYEEAVEYARAGLAIGEPRALEAWFLGEVLAPNATDITPVSGAVSIVDGIGALEGWLAMTYGGVGVIHAAAGLAASLGSGHQLVREGARYTTWLGNYVALGAGYELANVGPDGEDAPAGTSWMYITGPVVGRRDGVNLTPDTDSQSIDIQLNDRYVLAERTWVLGYECAVGAINVISAGCCGAGSAEAG